MTIAKGLSHVVRDFFFFILLFLGHRLKMLCPDELIQEAIEAHKNGEVKEEPEVNTVEFIMERSQEVLFRVHKITKL